MMGVRCSGVAIRRTDNYGHDKNERNNERGAKFHAVAFLGSPLKRVSLIGLVDFSLRASALAD